MTADKYQVLPALSDDDYARLRESIRERGVLVAVEVDEDGNILDGYHRDRIARELGIGYKTIARSGMAEHEKRIHAATLNLSRRHLTKEQKILVGRTIAPDVAERARLRQLAGVTLPANAGKGETNDEVAAIVGLGSGDTFTRGSRAIDRIEREAPQLMAGLAAGQVSLREAARDVRDFERATRVEQNQELVAMTRPVTGELFQTIIIDPPWDFGDEGDDSQFGRGRPTYATMTVDQIAAVGIPAATDAHIYLWITNRSLPKGFALLERWGFRYVTCLTWCKPSIGMGNYFRGSTEQVLFGVKGSLPLLRKDVGTWFSAARGGQHSAKPDAFYELVESCSPGPWLDMFSRSSRPGWTSWGAEAA